MAKSNEVHFVSSSGDMRVSTTGGGHRLEDYNPGATRDKVVQTLEVAAKTVIKTPKRSKKKQ